VVLRVVLIESRGIKLNYLTITKCDQLNGEGLRVVLWVSGCDHKCRECQNAYSWKPERGVVFDESAKQEVFAELEKDWCAGLTLSGGDPLYKLNRETVIDFCREVKQKYPNKTIWCYTGHTLEEVQKDCSMKGILDVVDVLVDGEFDCKKKSPELPWVGSSNQRVIRLRKV
jgi:anaerobic ribonucleoside-triphosphate reductase activating protein